MQKINWDEELNKIQTTMPTPTQMVNGIGAYELNQIDYVAQLIVLYFLNGGYYEN